MRRAPEIKNIRHAFLAEAKDQFANPSTLSERYWEVD